MHWFLSDFSHEFNRTQFSNCEDQFWMPLLDGINLATIVEMVSLQIQVLNMLNETLSWCLQCQRAFCLSWSDSAQAGCCQVQKCFQESHMAFYLLLPKEGSLFIGLDLRLLHSWWSPQSVRVHSDHFHQLWYPSVFMVRTSLKLWLVLAHFVTPTQHWFKPAVFLVPLKSPQWVRVH